jgi:hypothetical protein
MMTRYGIILGKKPPPAPPEPVKPIDYFMGVDFGMRSVEVIVGHLESSNFSIDFINQNFTEQVDIFAWLDRIQQMYIDKGTGTVKIRADQRGYQIWAGHFARTDGPPMEMIQINNTWKNQLRELCAFHNISHGLALIDYQVRHSSVNMKDFEDAHDLAISGAVESIQKKYIMTDALMTQTIHAKMRYHY